MKKRITLVAIMILVVASMTGCGTKARLRRRIVELNETIHELEEENRELKNGEKSQIYKDLENAGENENTNSYINVKFYKDGNLYRVDDIEFHFYRDQYCSVVAERMPIISPVVDEVQVRNGNYAYCVRAMQNGETVMLYSTQYPILEIIDYNDYNKYYDD